MIIPARRCAIFWPTRCGGLAGMVHAKRMKSFLRYVETSKARSAEQPPQEDSSDASYQRALINVDSVVPLPPDFVSPLLRLTIHPYKYCVHAICEVVLCRVGSLLPFSLGLECSYRVSCWRLTLC